MNNFKSAYVTALTEAIRKNPSKFAYGEDKAPEVAERMLAAIKSGNFALDGVIKQVAAKFGLKTKAALQEYLFKGVAAAARLAQNNISPKTVHAVLTIFVPLLAQCATEKKSIKAPVNIPKNLNATVQAVEKVFQRKWPELQMRVENKTAHVSYPPGMTVESIKEFLTNGLKKMLTSDGAAKVDVAAPEKEYSFTKARYSKGMIAVSCPSKDGYKTRASRLAGVFAARYSNREKAYIMTVAAVKKFSKAYAAGLDATITKELYHPDYPAV